MTRQSEIAALLALAFLVLVSAAWWALALWPVPSEAAAWLVRARFVCFNVGPSGLPDASGWLLLIGQPIGMFAALMAIWGSAVRSGLRRLAAQARGRVLIGAALLLLLGGLSAAGTRVVSANSEAVPFAVEPALPDTYPRLDRPAPALGLVDQRGERIDLSALRGRPALVTFAFAHCEAVCPTIVRQVVAAQRQLREGADASRVPRVVVVTLDPWRDTPSRLPALAQDYELGEGAFVLSGTVADVTGLLDRWNVARGRDEKTGMIAHPPLVYVLDAEGRIAFAATGGTETLLTLLGRT